MLEILLSIIVLVLAIPLGRLLADLTKHETNIYKEYFKILLWILAIFVILFALIDKLLFLIFAFMFLLIFSWYKANK